MNRSLPTGTVTFLFTDIVGSVPHWEKHPQAMEKSIVRHHALLRQAIEARKGQIFQVVGDAFQAAFSLSSQALEAAIEAQRLLQAEPWEETGPLQVRMGLHTGPAELDERGEYAVSHTLNRSARVMSVAHGGQILLSEETADLLKRTLPGGVSLKNLGEHRLKGMMIPEHLYQVCAAGLPQDFPSLTTATTPPNNLPVQLTSFVGREQEISEVTRLLQKHRLVLLTGSGGTGKTRLSLAIAEALLDDFPGGVYFISLASISDPMLVPSAVAGALGVRESMGKPLADSIKDYVSDKNLLILLDNFEQVTAAATWIFELLLSAPQLKVIITSREILHIYGEQDYPVPPLGLPNPKRLPTLERFMQYESIQLFIQRAQAVKPDFTITDTNAAAVAEICFRLDGLPLAIELAAARVRLLTPEALSSRLINRLQLLSGGSRNLPIRQQTLRNTVAWSYELLARNEQLLFTQLSVFNGGCTLEAAEAICQVENEMSMSVIDGLEALVGKSLMKQEGKDGIPRFTMLETIREYAAEKLIETGEAELIRNRHAVYFFKLAETARAFLEKSEQAIWLERLEQEHDNLRSALSWVKEHEQIELDVRFVETLCLFWFMRGHLTEGRARLTELLSFPKVLNNPLLHAKLLNQAGFLARYQGDYDAAYRLISQSLAMCRQQDNRNLTADVMANLGYVVLHQNDYIQARTFYTETLHIYRELNNMQGVADSLSHLALIAFYEGDFETARSYDEESLAIWRNLEDKQGIAWALHKMGNVAFHQGDIGVAADLFRESLLIANELGSKWGVSSALEGLASIAAAQGEAERGLRLAGAASALRQEIGIPLSPAGLSVFEKTLAPARQALGTHCSNEAWRNGQTLDMAESVQYALEFFR